MNIKLQVVDAEGGYKIAVESGILPDMEKNKRYIDHVYKYKHVAVARAKTIEAESQQK